MTSDPEWSPCEPGTLSSIVTRSGTNPARRNRRAALAAIVTAAAGGGLFLLRTDRSGTISCVQVQKLGPDYVAGGLAARQAGRIDAHRRECAKCDSMLRRLEREAARPV